MSRSRVRFARSIITDRTLRTVRKVRPKGRAIGINKMRLTRALFSQCKWQILFRRYPRINLRSYNPQDLHRVALQCNLRMQYARSIIDKSLAGCSRYSRSLCGFPSGSVSHRGAEGTPTSRVAADWILSSHLARRGRKIDRCDDL